MSLYPNIDRLDTLTFGWLKNGVQTLRKLLKKLGNPQDSFQVFHVAWTNGKWSTCQLLSQILWREFGHTVGMTISPHLIDLNERIQINGVQISNSDLNNYLKQTFTITQESKVSLSFFEHMILVAFLYFRDQKVDYAVIEVGLWGKYDATNVFTHPLATLITTISDDHRHLLWPTLTQIFWNKVGILKKDVPCFTRLDTPLMRYAAMSKWVPLYEAKELITTNLEWVHQQQNAGLVFHCLTTLGRDAQRIKKWLTHITNPWRTQWLTENILVDGAHNEEWIAVFQQYITSVLRRYKKIITVFWSTKKREDYPWFFSRLIVGDTNYLVTPSIERRAVAPDNYQQYLSFATIDAGTLNELRPTIPFHEKNTLIVVYGSLYLVGEAIQLHTWDSSWENK